MKNKLAIYLNSLKFSASLWEINKEAEPVLKSFYSEKFQERISGIWNEININPVMEFITENLTKQNLNFKGDFFLSIPDTWTKVVLLDTEGIKKQDELGKIALWKINQSESFNPLEFRISFQLWKEKNKALALISQEALVQNIEKWSAGKGLKIKKIIPHSLAALSLANGKDEGVNFYLFVNEDSFVSTVVKDGILEYHRFREADYTNSYSLEKLLREIKSTYIQCKQKFTNIDRIYFFIIPFKNEINACISKIADERTGATDLSGLDKISSEAMITRGLF